MFIFSKLLIRAFNSKKMEINQNITKITNNVILIQVKFKDKYDSTEINKNILEYDSNLRQFREDKHKIETEIVKLKNLTSPNDNSQQIITLIDNITKKLGYLEKSITNLENKINLFKEHLKKK
jgi:hypothetical protein